jgi:RHS repeat-associated protein
LPVDLTTVEWREALRACKGMPLHVEVYSPDGSDQEIYPYTTAQHTCLIQLLQPMLSNEHAVFMVLESEALTYTYERDPADPRIAHSMNIKVDEFGNVLESAAISYGRKTVDMDLLESEQAEQSKTHIVFTGNNFTNDINEPADYRLRVLYEAQTFELTGIIPQTGNYFSIDEVSGDFQGANEIAYQVLPTEGQKEKRLVEHVRSVFTDKNDLSVPLAPGAIDSLALPYQSYKLALTPALVQYIFGDKVNEDLLLNEGKYFHFNDGNYWIASGTQTYDAAHFYQVIEMMDPFGYKAQINYDTVYYFFVQQTTDALNNSLEILKFNFRTLSPYLTKDINDNRSGVRLDELGMVMSAFVMGKENENKGDLFDANSTEASNLDKPGSILEYDLFQYINNGKPNYIKTTVNETDYFYSIQNNKPIITQTSYMYVCGGGKEVLKKLQAEPGIALQENADGTVTEVDTTPNLRWIGNGRTILNNKGKPVKQYEPYFSTTPDYEDAKELVERGVTPIIYYDSAGRVIKTELPDGSFSKVEFDSWKQLAYDQNDTVLESTWYTDRINGLLNDEFIQDGKDPVKEKEAAQKAAAHANTPAIIYFDSLGRNFLSIADNGDKGKYKTISETDIEGNLKKITDARGNAVMQYKYDMLSNQLYSLSMDAGERWMINDVMGKPMKTWDSRDHIFRYEYDQLHRPLKTYVTTEGAAEINFGKIAYGDVYGEDAGTNKPSNLRGKIYQQFDAAGIVTNTSYDFKGNLLESSRQLYNEYRNDIDWTSYQPVEDEIEIFSSSTVFDALNRPITITAPDNSIITPAYNEAALLESISVNLKGAAAITVFVKDIDYNEKGQRESIIYGNDTKTNYVYDRQTFRLIHLTTNRKDETDALQKLSYTYDAVGNITYMKDEAQQTFFYNNNLVEPSCDYVYDAIYQLIKATGREHIAQNQLPQDNWRDENFINLVLQGDDSAMRNYTQNFLYDEVGNIQKLQHSAGNGSYTRNYAYANNNNQLLSTSIGNDDDHTNYTFPYTHDAHGNIDTMPHLTLMQWNFKDQLQITQQTAVNNGTGEQTFYVYDGNGQRIRKVTTQQGSGNKKEERIYLGSFEIYRSYNADGISIELERETLHINDDKTKLALVETKTKDNGSSDGTTLNQAYIRYQFTNHLDSACLELNVTAQIISYEEYHPYGTTSYQAMDKTINVVAKRYRYTGMERDEESGFEYHSARYYLPWLGRWLSTDPIQIMGGINFYEYTRNSPNVATDKNGLEPNFEKFNQEADKNNDKRISYYELNNALVCSTVSPQQWANYMLSNSNAYRVEGGIDFLLLLASPPGDDGLPEPSQSSIENSYNNNVFEGDGYNYTLASNDKAADELSHPSRKIGRDLKVFTESAAVVLIPDYYFLSRSIYYSATGHPGEAAKDLVLGSVGKILEKALGIEAVEVARDTGPYSPQRMRQHLEERYGASNVTSTTAPPTTHHSVMVNSVDIGGGRSVGFDTRGLPDFSPFSVTSARVPRGDYTGEMRAATRQLREALKRGDKLSVKFTVEQLKAIRGGKAKIPGYTWHHVSGGELQLVPEDIHDAVPHIGTGAMRGGR